MTAHDNGTYVTSADPVAMLLGREAAEELTRATRKFGAMASPHEGWAVIYEEIDELWEHVKGNTGSSTEARTEAVQIAAMALRYIHDLCGESDSLSESGEAS